MKWIPIKEFPNYEISDEGKVRSIAHRIKRKSSLGNDYYIDYKSKEISQYKSNRKGSYFYVTLNKTIGSTRYRMPVHQLMMENFVGPCPEGKEVAHNDGNELNNNLSNLRYATHEENCFDKISHGTHLFGENSGTVKLTDLQCLEIISDNRSYRTIAKDYNIDYSHVSRLKNSKTREYLK